AKLWVDCVVADENDEDEDNSNAIRVIGGRWPTDGHPWKLSHDDAVLYVDSNELELLVDPKSVCGKELPITVAEEEGGRRCLRVEGDPDALLQLRQRSATDGEGD
ncbi:hypothetical protein, partial [Mycobacterium sp. 1423905.2]|uniref:hypothetical protein n=1 Tax=Mycobacterium sp. 1423905.2 TaxID=1856859 RepID=UPI0015608C59